MSIRVFDYDYAYLESGPPASSNYTTWVIFHGMGFNAAVFEKLFPLAHAHNLRIVSVYRRGYSPSSGFTEDELGSIGPGKKYAEAVYFFRKQGHEVATFLAKFATEHDIPWADRVSHTGGVALIGWSLASIHALMLLAYVDDLPSDTRSTLHRYLHTVLSHDAGQYVFGAPNPPQHNISFWSETDDRKLFDAFLRRATAHFVHKSVTSENLDDLSFDNPSTATPGSLHELSKEERAKYTNLEGFTVCDRKLLFCDPTAFKEIARRALLDKARAEAFPDIRVRYLSGGETDGILVNGLWSIRRITEDPKQFYGGNVEKARDVKFLTAKDGNHFVFWEEPKKAIEQYSAAINL